MGIGHVAIGLGLKPAAPRLSAGYLVFAAFLADFLLGVFAFLGWESSTAPPDYAHKHYLLFSFPYSHSLLTLLLWSALAAVLVLLTSRPAAGRTRAAWVVAAAVFSHFVLDAIVHVRGLPLAGEDSFKIGLGLWNYLVVEQVLEAAMLVAALILYLRSTSGRTFGARFGMAIFCLVLAAVTIPGQLLSREVPSRNALVGSWFLVPILLATVVFWLDRERAPTGEVAS